MHEHEPEMAADRLHPPINSKVAGSNHGKYQEADKPMFEDFEEKVVSTSQARIYLRLGGSGPPLLLLHGYPQNHVIWRRTAARLSRRFTLIVPDLRGYGQSQGPPPDPDHLMYSKRAMAADMVELMEMLGWNRFFIAGHDRGARVAYRLALDHPSRVLRAAFLDIIPTFNVWERIDRSTALKTYHWMFLSQPAPLPETLIGSDPDYYLLHLLDRWAGRRRMLTPDAVDEYLKHFRKPSVIQATCEDYRAGATVDYDHDAADREAGRLITCPSLIMWGRGYLKDKASSPLQVWKTWAGDVREIALDCGHFVAEEQPEECAAGLEDFFSG